MPSELDRRFDTMLATVVGPGGRLIIEQDEQGRAIVANFPATLPSFFRTFCALNADARAEEGWWSLSLVVCGPAPRALDL